MNKKQVSGFSLIEIMITIAIVAILASIAWASYSNSIEKSRRADARDALTRAAAAQEQRMLQFNQFTDDETLIGGNASSEGFYTILSEWKLGATDCSAVGDRRCFTITATAQGAQANDTNCTTFTLDNLGRRQAFDSGSTDTTDICW